MRYFLFLLGFLFVGCTTTYVEIYNVERYPMSWDDTIIYKEDHWHFCDTNDVWYCIELEADTVQINCKDTLVIKQLVTKYKIRKNDNRRTK